MLQAKTVCAEPGPHPRLQIPPLPSLPEGQCREPALGTFPFLPTERQLLGLLVQLARGLGRTSRTGLEKAELAGLQRGRGLTPGPWGQWELPPTPERRHPEPLSCRVALGSVCL